MRTMSEAACTLQAKHTAKRPHSIPRSKSRHRYREAKEGSERCSDCLRVTQLTLGRAKFKLQSEFPSPAPRVLAGVSPTVPRHPPLDTPGIASEPGRKHRQTRPDLVGPGNQHLTGFPPGIRMFCGT